MSIQIVIDMNLSPEWVNVFATQGWHAVHWSTVGNPRAADHDIMKWARSNNHVVFTHDLDFGTLLALTQSTGPSVIQVRGQNVLPDHLSSIVVTALKQYESDLAAGALVVVDESKYRARILPI